MTFAALYHALASFSAPNTLLPALGEAIADHYALPFVYLTVGVNGVDFVRATWSKDPTLAHITFPTTVHPPKARLYHPAKDSPYIDLVKTKTKFGAIAVLPFQDTEQHQGWLILGATEKLPALSKLKEALLPPLHLALQLLTLQVAHRESQAHNDLIAQINTFIDRETSTTKLLQLAIAAAKDCLGTDLGVAGLFKYKNPLQAQNTQGICPVATLNIINPLPVDFIPKQLPLQNCQLCQQAWLNAPNVLAIDHYTDAPQTSILAQHYKSFLIVPLMGQGASTGQNNTVLGLLGWAQTTPRHWNPKEIQLATFIAHQLSTALIHQRSLRQVQSLVEERTAQLKWSLDVQAKLGAKMRQQIQQLRQLNVLKDEFLSTMSHELNTPLATMRMAIKMLRQPGRSPEKQETYFNILEQELTRESKLIQDLLKLQHFESEQFALKPQRLNLSPILEKLQKEFNDRWQLLKGIHLQLYYIPDNIAHKLQIETDEESLSNALSELLVNAGKYSTPNTEVSLEVEYLAKAPAQVQLRLSNYGAGITPEEQQFIFEKFRRGAGVTDKAIPGTGLGLALVKALVEQLEGTIAVSSDPTDETDIYCTCFTLTFPQSMVGL